MADTDAVFIGRQPILDRAQQLCAYELLFRSGRQNEANIEDDLVATASVIRYAFGEIGVEQALGPYRGFLNCDESVLQSDALEILPPDKIVLEILETVSVTPLLVDRCRELKTRGFTLALDDYRGIEDKFRPLLDIIEIVKVDLLAIGPAALAETTQALRRWPVQLLAEKVENRERAQACHELGYTYFQGYYFARPDIIAGRKLGHSQMILLHLLGLVLDDADSHVIEQALKKEPALVMNLMRLTNSVATGVRVKIASLGQAITVLGRRQLQRWLQLLLFTNPGSGQIANPLLQLAASRGRLMELLAGRLRPAALEFEDRAFMAGIMSLMPALMGVPMAEVLKGINLGTDVRDALERREGDLGVMLALAEMLEDGHGCRCHELVEQLPGMDHTFVNCCVAQALNWAASIGQPNEQ